LPTTKKILLLTPTVRKFTTWNVLFFLILILIVNVIFIFITVFILHSGIDKRISHEIDNVIATLEIKDTVINIVDFRELNEHSFNSVEDGSFFLQVYDLRGNILISSNNLKEYEVIPLFYDVEQNEIKYSDLDLGEDRLRMGYKSLQNERGDEVAILQLVTFETELKTIRDKHIEFNLNLLPGLILIVIVVSIFIAKKSFKPINYIIETAERISAKKLSSRIVYETKSGDELGRLRDTLNGLFDRIESYVNQLSQFTDHASHQLMNPLTAVKTELEFILKHDRSTEEYKHETNKTVFNLTKLIKSNIPSEIDSHLIKMELVDDIYIRGDSGKFLMVIENLVDNAVKYSLNNEPVTISLGEKDNEVEFIVEDKGIGIKPMEKGQIFNKFYRGKASETVGIKGHGLGLSLVKTILLEMGATIKIEDNLPTGSRFIVKIKALKMD
jgi:signal transduction histidine kinase